MEENLKQMLIGMQNKMIEDSRQLSTVKAQIQAKEREKRLSELTYKEVSQIGDNIRTYKSVGKMFLQADKSVLEKEIKGRIDVSNEGIKALEKKATYLERNINEINGNLKDIFNRRS
ncbi:Prefoldin [Basidiobolus meristosporus CBS 931.73]|uniref:Prefoldin n=1 Tax=Basidiobolus meristosporus CBS 931.73 TaxID=1314790 RepID=A0A1Y1X779_9FUNG|nr:Prefoldin [Basidiobolus meristosporus CBS 931.73]|eukprot:ORX81621.1 Prefoldin [Basidiobolus meristosporus CBS 931.73]